MPHWLFINGVQPVIPENAPLASGRTAAGGGPMGGGTKRVRGVATAAAPAQEQQGAGSKAPAATQKQQGKGLQGGGATWLFESDCHILEGGLLDLLMFLSPQMLLSFHPRPLLGLPLPPALLPSRQVSSRSSSPCTTPSPRSCSFTLTR